MQRVSCSATLGGNWINEHFDLLILIYLRRLTISSRCQRARTIGEQAVWVLSRPVFGKAPAGWWSVASGETSHSQTHAFLRPLHLSISKTTLPGLNPDWNREGEFSIRSCTSWLLSFPCLFHSRPLDARGWRWTARQGPSSARTNQGLGAPRRVDSLPAAGFHAVVELTAAGLSPSCRISRIVSSNPFLPTTAPKRWLTLFLSPPVAPSTINTSTTLHHHPAQVSSRPLCQSFCSSSTFSCRFALGIRMLFQSCDLGVPAFVQCSSFGWPRRVALGVTRF